jgi:hypothetical protein
MPDMDITPATPSALKKTLNSFAMQYMNMSDNSPRQTHSDSKEGESMYRYWGPHTRPRAHSWHAQ